MDRPTYEYELCAKHLAQEGARQKSASLTFAAMLMKELVDKLIEREPGETSEAS